MKTYVLWFQRDLSSNPSVRPASCLTSYLTIRASFILLLEFEHWFLSMESVRSKREDTGDVAGEGSVVLSKFPNPPPFHPFLYFLSSLFFYWPQCNFTEHYGYSPPSTSRIQNPLNSLPLRKYKNAGDTTVCPCGITKQGKHY